MLLPVHIYWSHKGRLLVKKQNKETLTEYLRKLKANIQSQSRSIYSRPDHVQLSESEKHSIALETAEEFFKLSTRIWNIALVSIPFDFLLIAYAEHIRLPELVIDYVFPLFLFVSGLAIAFSFREFVTSIFQASYAQIQKRPYIKIVCIIGIVAITAASLVVELFLYSSTTVFSSLVQILIYGAAFYSLVAGTNKKTNSIQQYVTLIKRDLFVATILPLFAARLILPLGIITLEITNKHSGYGSLLALSALTLFTLFELAPDLSHFITRCRRCSIILPLRLLEKPVCLHCTKDQPQKARH